MVVYLIQGSGHPDAFIGCNLNIQKADCTLETCCLAQSSFLYLPNLAGNLFFAIFFGVFIIPQLGLGIYYRTWGFMISMFIGCALEVVGYASRVWLHYNPFAGEPFLIYLITLTIAPVFVSAAIYLSITRIIVLYGEHLSFLKPRTIACLFMTSDLLSLVLQAIGGGVAYTALITAQSNQNLQREGIDTMIAGLLLQAISLALFLAYMALFAWRCRTGQVDTDPAKKACRTSTMFKIFIGSTVFATIVVLIRSIFRVAELWGGFAGDLWNNETDFLVLDGAMVAIAVLLLSIFHPGPAFGTQWSAANWTFRTKTTGNRKTSSDLEEEPKTGELK